MGHWYIGLLPVLACIAFALLACFLVSRFLCKRTICCVGGTHGPNIPRDSPKDVLKARYAKGEIGREEFERMKKELREE
jgi:uncharacterized membrane protein